MVCVVLIPCFALLLGYVQKPFAMRSHVFVGCICRAYWRIYVFFLTLVNHSCAVNVNSVSDAFSTNQKIDLFVTLVTLDVR